MDPFADVRTKAINRRVIIATCLGVGGGGVACVAKGGFLFVKCSTGTNFFFFLKVNETILLNRKK